jgi:tetratricopeptide (TPR) repeat protein
LLVVWLRPRIPLRWALPALAGVACSSALFYYSPAGDHLRNRTRWFIEDPAGGARLWLWRDSLRMASSRWTLGYGPETFGVAFPRFQSEELARAYPDFYHESPHNVFLDALSGQGVVGMAVLLALCALGFSGARRARGAEPVLSAAVAAALLALLVSLQFTGFMSVTMLHFYLLLAVAVTASHAAAAPAERKRRAPALAVLAVVPLVWFAVKLAVTDRALAAAARATDEAKFRQSIAAYGRAWRWRPPGEFADLWFSRRMVGAVRDAPAAADRSQAMQRAFRAALSAPETAADRQNAWYSLAAFHAARNDYPATESSLRAAIRDAPRWFKPHWTLARLLLISGRMAEAEREAALAVELNGGKHAEVAQTLDEVRARLAAAPNPLQP